MEIILFVCGGLPENILLRIVFALTARTKTTTKKDEPINFLSKRFTSSARLRYRAVMSDHGSALLDRILKIEFPYSVRALLQCGLLPLAQHHLSLMCAVVNLSVMMRRGHPVWAHLSTCKNRKKKR